MNGVTQILRAIQLGTREVAAPKLPPTDLQNDSLFIDQHKIGDSTTITLQIRGRDADGSEIARDGAARTISVQFGSIRGRLVVTRITIIITRSSSY